MAPDISVIVCTYNRDKYIGECIRKLAGQKIVPGRLEIVVVNNNSTDGTDAICTALLEEFPDGFRYFVEYEQGLSHARNRGMKEAAGNILAFIDDDAMAEPDYAEKLADFYASNPGADATGGRIHPLYESQPPKWLNPFLRPLLSVIDLGDSPKPFEGRKYPIGANMAFRRSAIDATGDFNVSLGRTGKNMMGSEEKDIFQRMRDKGMQIWYVPDAIVHHVVPEARLTEEFIKKQGHGVGKSENVRLRTAGRSLGSAYFRELFKWAATFAIAFGYLIALAPAKSRMLILFRYWVSKGLLAPSRD
jgi:glucosyl-dolichyl phosphate glucuronosyltransferase